MPPLLSAPLQCFSSKFVTFPALVCHSECTMAGSRLLDHGILGCQNFVDLTSTTVPTIVSYIDMFLSLSFTSSLVGRRSSDEVFRQLPGLIVA
jgi:hypothetical protein